MTVKAPFNLRGQSASPDQDQGIFILAAHIFRPDPRGLTRFLILPM